MACFKRGVNRSNSLNYSALCRFMHSKSITQLLQHPEISNGKISKDGDHIQGYMHLSDGEHIYFQSSGLRGLYEERVKKETSVVLLHGQKYHSQTWNQNGTLKYLFDNKYGNIAFDMKGYGNSSGKRETFENANMDWIIQCLDKLGVNRNIVLIMPSMSGLYGLQWMFNTKYSTYLSGIIPIAPAFCAQYDKELFKTIDIPTCIVYGENDETGLHNESNSCFVQIPKHKQFMIANAPHACYLKSNANEFHDIMLNFIDELENHAPSIAHINI
eukprot:1032966_1